MGRLIRGWLMEEGAGQGRLYGYAGCMHRRESGRGVALDLVVGGTRSSVVASPNTTRTMGSA